LAKLFSKTPPILVKYNANITKDEIRKFLDLYYKLQTASDINNYIKERKIQLISDAFELKLAEYNSTPILEKSAFFLIK
jgi:hypothetical protein